MFLFTSVLFEVNVRFYVGLKFQNQSVCSKREVNVKAILFDPISK